MTHSVLRYLCMLLVLPLVLVACASGDAGDTGEPAAGTDETTDESTGTETDGTSSEPAAAPEGEPIQFAAVISQTGAQAVLGELQQAAMEMAVEEVNEAGGVLGRPLEVNFQDAGEEAATGVAATQRALANDPVAILGHQYSFMVFPLVDVVADAQIPFLHGAQTVELAADQEGTPWHFRVRSSDALSARSLVELAVEELGAQAPAIHHGSDPVSVGFREQAARLLEEEGIEAVAVESHDLGDSDMTAQIRSIINADPDVVMVQTFVQESATIARQHEELGLEAPTLYGPAALFAVGFDLIDGELLNGDYMSLDAVPEYSDDPDEQEWVQRFSERYPDLSPNAIASSWYAAVLMLADGIERAGTTDPEPLRDALAETQLTEFNGIPLPGFELNCTNPEQNCFNKRELVQFVDGEPEIVSTYRDN